MDDALSAFLTTREYDIISPLDSSSNNGGRPTIWGRVLLLDVRIAIRD